MKCMKYLFAFSVLLVIAAMNIHNFHAMFWKAENATVILKNCEDNCEFNGTLRIIPFDGRYKLETEDGEIVFGKDSFKMITVAVKK